MNRSRTVIMWLALALVAAGFVAFGLPAEEPVFCTLDARQCPDGSYVGRTGPKCEFAACPAQEGDANWQTMQNEEIGVSFRYPAEFSTKYIRAFDWPPQVAVTDGPFLCTEAGSEMERAGRTERRMVDDRTYCVTRITEGAAGSIYTQYAYAFERGDKVAILTFSTRAVQCGNYSDPQKSECEGEREAFDIDSVMDKVATSFRFE